MKVPEFKFQHALGFLLVILGFIFFFILLFHTPPEQNRETINYIVGFICGTAVGSVIAFAYNTTVGSKKKDEMLMNAIQPPPSEPTEKPE